MNRNQYIVALLISSLVGGISACTNNSECNVPNGHCHNGQCFCLLLYGGNHCEEDWRQDKQWSAVFWTYDALVTLCHCVIFGLFSYQLYITCKYFKVGGWTLWNAVTVAIICILVGVFVDPFNYRKILPWPFVEVLFSVALLLFLNSVMLLLLNLVEVMQQKGIEKLAFLHKFKWYFVAFSFVMTVVTSILALWRATSGLSEASTNLYNFAFGVALLVVVGVDISLGIAVTRLLKMVNNNTLLSGNDVRAFLLKLQKFSIVTTVVILIAVLSIIIYALIKAAEHRWSWLILNMIYRGVEIVMLQQVYPLIRKEVPTETQEMNTRKSSIAETVELT